MKKLLSTLLSISVILACFFCFGMVAQAYEEGDYCDHWDLEEAYIPATTTQDGAYGEKCITCGEFFEYDVIPSIDSMTLSTTSYTYDGSTKKPTVRVYDSWGNTIGTSNFTVSRPSSSIYAGKYTVKVTFNGVKYKGTKTASYTIKPALEISKSTFVVGQKYTLKVKGTKSSKSFKSSNKAVATVNSDGVITGKKAGTATITVTTNGVSATKKITIKNPSLSVAYKSVAIAKGKAFTVKATPSPSTAKVTWSSSNKSIAGVSSSGKISAYKKGSCTVTAKFTYQGKTYKKTITVYVRDPKLSKTSVTLNNGKTTTLSVTGGSGTIEWSSSNKKIATVTSSGKIKAYKKGTCTIYAKVNHKTLSCKVTVSSKYNGTNIPDLGAYIGVCPYKKTTDDGMTFYYYDMSELDAKNEDWFGVYLDAIDNCGFYIYDTDYDDYNLTITVGYENSKWDAAILLDFWGDYVIVGYQRQ